MVGLSFHATIRAQLMDELRWQMHVSVFAESARPPTSHREVTSGAMSIRSLMGGSPPAREPADRGQESARAEAEDMDDRVLTGVQRRKSRKSSSRFLIARDNCASRLDMPRHMFIMIGLFVQELTIIPRSG